MKRYKLTHEDLKSIAQFHAIVKNYIKMKRIEKEHETRNKS